MDFRPIATQVIFYPDWAIIQSGQEHKAHFCSKFKNKLRTIQPQQKDKVSNFQLKKWTKQQKVPHN